MFKTFFCYFRWVITRQGNFYSHLIFAYLCGKKAIFYYIILYNGVSKTSISAFIIMPIKIFFTTRHFGLFEQGAKLDAHLILNKVQFFISLEWKSNALFLYCTRN